MYIRNQASEICVESWWHNGFMKRLLLSLLFIPFFAFSSWANPEKPSGNSPDVNPWRDNIDYSEYFAPDGTSGAFNEGYSDLIDPSTTKAKKKSDHGEKQSVKQGQQRRSGWGQKPTSIQRKPGGLKRKVR
tara:strand:+ start:13 stop:405 length:393 start_codon:yes stop_codon:yes gene_type:complete